jgi:hypothetical protein
MKLSGDPVKLARMAADELKEAILERRAAIRKHRDAKGDDRCWLDDYFVWDLLDYSPRIEALPSFDEGMSRCCAFYTNRRADAPDLTPSDAIADPKKWDADIAPMTQPQLAKELARIQEAIRRHRDVKDRPRCLDDDRTLYAVLPEKLPADFRLPPENEFIGEDKAPHAGCPSFWRSHANCTAKRHNLHQWGPCRDE